MNLPQMMKRESTDYFKKGSVVKSLTPKDFDQMTTYLLKSKKPTFVLFYAPWCGYCKRYKEDHLKLASIIFDCVDVCAFNCEKYSDHMAKMNIDYEAKASSRVKKSERFIPSYPTLYFYENGKPKKFEGDRTIENILKFVLNSCGNCKCSK